ncbi:LysR family transcriptional regulator [Marinicrinis sediminis]|uniref:LysR family transcriptional regulator n=1 Tax=Marinicrinis sediminis TaxID=1652465 RepID=A0ABW5R6Y4_9BACL
MNVNQLETLIAVSQTKSFRKAGEVLNLTQPAVSAQIKSLEDEFQTVLLNRNHPVTLTESGKIFLEQASKILGQVEELKQRLSDLHQLPQGNIQLGTTTSIAIQVLPRVLSYFQDQFPMIKTTIHSMTSSQVISSVENGSIDLGISFMFDQNPQLESSILYYDSFELVVAPEHPLAEKSHASIHCLKDLPMIMLSPETAGRKFLDRLLLQFHIQPQVVMELSSSEEVKRMVEINLGAAIISRSAITQELKRGTLKRIQLHELSIAQPVSVFYRSGRYLNAAIRQFLNDLKGMPESQFLGSE